jgi:recombinational DNA repair protein (RecF pathway)
VLCELCGPLPACIKKLKIDNLKLIIKSQSIVLKSDNYRSSSKLVTLYTEDLGKLRCIAKGVRDTRTKWGSVLQPMSCLNTIIYYKENKSLHLLSSAEHEELFLSLYDDFGKTNIAYRLLELILRTTTDNHPNKEMFKLLKESLSVLNSSDTNLHNILLAFEFRLAELLGIGVQPDTFRARGQAYRARGQAYRARGQAYRARGLAPLSQNDDLLHEPATLYPRSSVSPNMGYLYQVVNSLKRWNFKQKLDFNISKDTLILLDNFFEEYFRSHFEHKYPSKTRKISGKLSF